MSEYLNLNGKDLIKGLIIAAITAGLASIQTILAEGDWPSGDQWVNIAKIVGASVISYLIKNLFTNSKDEPFKPEP